MSKSIPEQLRFPPVDGMTASVSLPHDRVWDTPVARNRLANATAIVPRPPGDKAVLDWTQLKLLLEGIDVTTARHYKRYRHPQHARTAV